MCIRDRGEVKVQLRRVPGARLEVALGPAAGFRWISAAGASMQVSYLTLPLLLGVDVGRHQIVVAPEAGVQLWTSAGANAVWAPMIGPVSYTHLRAHETPEHLVCRLL